MSKAEKIFYILFALGSLMIITGIILDHECYEKTPQDFYRNEVCKWIAKIK